QKGEDINASITVPLTDAFEGSTRRINFELQSVSPDGQVQKKPISLNVKIPKGIKNGQKIRLAGQGSPGYNGEEKGDMFLKVEFEQHPYFKAEGADIYIDLPIAPWEAALGNTINIPTPAGNIKLKVPSGSKQGKKLRLKGKGIPSKVPGDLYVTINIALPPADSEKARKMYEEMKELNFNPRENFRSLSPEFVIEMVEHGILEPEGERRTAWRFSYDAIENARKVMRLRRDLNINISGAALALELLERIERLEALLERNP
ncbi:unnamed protein product, partial [Cyprideis torosa]